MTTALKHSMITQLARMYSLAVIVVRPSVWWVSGILVLCMVRVMYNCLHLQSSGSQTVGSVCNVFRDTFMSDVLKYLPKQCLLNTGPLSVYICSIYSIHTFWYNTIKHSNQVKPWALGRSKHLKCVYVWSAQL